MHFAAHAQLYGRNCERGDKRAPGPRLPACRQQPASRQHFLLRCHVMVSLRYSWPPCACHSLPSVLPLLLLLAGGSLLAAPPESGVRRGMPCERDCERNLNMPRIASQRFLELGSTS